MQGLCELLCEEPFYVPSDLTPSLEQLKAVEEHIRAMEELKVMCAAVEGHMDASCWSSKHYNVLVPVTMDNIPAPL